MEKRRPHYDLRIIKATFARVETLRLTRTAHDSALRMGLTLADVVEIILGITQRQFYKSMTSIHDSRIWQDVYHVRHRDLVIYLKFTVDVSGYSLISFKEK